MRDTVEREASRACRLRTHTSDGKSRWHAVAPEAPPRVIHRSGFAPRNFLVAQKNKREQQSCHSAQATLKRDMQPEQAREGDAENVALFEPQKHSKLVNIRKHCRYDWSGTGCRR